MQANTKHFFQLNAFQLKLMALITMTIDHFGAYQTFTINQAINDGLRIIGRAAAPLFLFLVTEGLRHTHDKAKYILRLYTAGVIIEIINRIIEKNTETPGLGNTLPMFFYTALFAFCTEQMIHHRDQIKTVCTAACGLLLPFLFYILHVLLLENGFSIEWYLISIFFPSPLHVDYSILFVLLGTAWYFIDNRIINCAIFAFLSLICKIVPVSVFFSTALPMWFRPVYFDVFSLFIDTQWCMCFAVPFMLLYNGEKGRGLKYLFYIYYPLHVYILFFIQYLRN